MLGVPEALDMRNLTQVLDRAYSAGTIKRSLRNEIELPFPLSSADAEQRNNRARGFREDYFPAWCAELVGPKMVE